VTERRFAELLSRLRLGAEALTSEDVALLRTRVCGQRGHGSCASCIFDDKVERRTRHGRRRKRHAQPMANGDDDSGDEGVYVTTKCKHCEIGEGATVIAALCSKVNELNARHEASVESTGTRVLRADAIDRSVGGIEILDERARAAIDKRARGQLPTLGLYVGMHALLTQNQDMESDNINGSPGVVVAIETDPDDDDEPVVIRFRPDSAAAHAPPLCIKRKHVRVTAKGVGSATRFQFPLLPAHAITVHRVQGSTLDGEIHVLFNAEFFAVTPRGSLYLRDLHHRNQCDPPHHHLFVRRMARSQAGQAYTALSRARRLSQLHLWGFDLAAIKANPHVAREYRRLARRPLTRAHVDAARTRPSAPLASLSAIAAPHPASFEAY
jgi:hypothetical protein